MTLFAQMTRWRGSVYTFLFWEIFEKAFGAAFDFGQWERSIRRCALQLW